MGPVCSDTPSPSGRGSPSRLRSDSGGGDSTGGEAPSPATATRRSLSSLDHSLTLTTPFQSRSDFGIAINSSWLLDVFRNKSSWLLDDLLLAAVVCNFSNAMFKILLLFCVCVLIFNLLTLRIWNCSINVWRICCDFSTMFLLILIGCRAPQAANSKPCLELMWSIQSSSRLVDYGVLYISCFGYTPH